MSFTILYGFGSKMGLFPIFFFRQYRPGKCLLPYSRTKKRLSKTIKTRNLKSQKIDVFPNGLTHGFSLKMAIFQPFFFAI